MSSLISKLMLAAGIAVTLGACASLEAASSTPEYDRLAQISPGLTREEVRSLAGNPDNVTGDSRSGGDALWVYSFNDEWGYPSEFDVTFGDGGVVTDTYSERNR
jgi:outer membrane protein assembly factor BamE (lipoprotein component of BamABCDE complex)